MHEHFATGIVASPKHDLACIERKQLARDLTTARIFRAHLNARARFERSRVVRAAFRPFGAGKKNSSIMSLPRPEVRCTSPTTCLFNAPSRRSRR